METKIYTIYVCCNAVADQQKFEQNNLIMSLRAQTRSVKTAFKKRQNQRPIPKRINFAQDILIPNTTRALIAENVHKTLNVISEEYKIYPCQGILKCAEVFVKEIENSKEIHR